MHNARPSGPKPGALEVCWLSTDVQCQRGAFPKLLGRQDTRLGALWNCN